MKCPVPHWDRLKKCVTVEVGRLAIDWDVLQIPLIIKILAKLQNHIHFNYTDSIIVQYVLNSYTFTVKMLWISFQIVEYIFANVL